MQSRYYNADWGRFVNTDAIAAVTGELLSANMFTYCKNNPTTLKDPSGFRSVYTQGEETDEMREASYKVMNKAARNKASISTISSKSGTKRTLDKKGESNSRDTMHDQDGNVKQERAYDPAGDVLDDLDWGHGGTHVFPHRHGWVNGKRDKIGVPFQGPPPPPMSASGWVIAGTILYWTISEGSRVVFPPRNLIPIP